MLDELSEQLRGYIADRERILNGEMKTNIIKERMKQIYRKQGKTREQILEMKRTPFVKVRAEYLKYVDEQITLLRRRIVQVEKRIA